MPASNPPVREHPGKPFRKMKDAARDSQIVTVECAYCKRKRNYLASDLVKVVGSEWPLHEPPFQCPAAHSNSFMRVRVWTPTAEHLGRIYVRRPERLVWKWKSVRFGNSNG